MQEIDAHRISDRCPNKQCRTRGWNRTHTLTEKHGPGRPDKGRINKDTERRPILDGLPVSSNGHHALCPCLVCLKAIGQQTEEERKARELKAEDREALRQKQWEQYQRWEIRSKLEPDELDALGLEPIRRMGSSTTAKATAKKFPASGTGVWVEASLVGNLTPEGNQGRG